MCRKMVAVSAIMGKGAIFVTKSFSRTAGRFAVHGRLSVQLDAQKNKKRMRTDEKCLLDALLDGFFSIR